MDCVAEFNAHFPLVHFSGVSGIQSEFVESIQSELLNLLNPDHFVRVAGHAVRAAQARQSELLNLFSSDGSV